MKNLLFSLFAVGVAAVAAMTATTAMLNAPQRAQPVVVSTLGPEETPDSSPGTVPASSLAQDSKPASEGGAAKPAEPGSATGAAADKTAGADGEEEGDKDPYEGIPEEELPPDMQYSADSSVSFPTNI